MLIISRIFHSYKDSLRHSKKRYENAYLNNAYGVKGAFHKKPAQPTTLAINRLR